MKIKIILFLLIGNHLLLAQDDLKKVKSRNILSKEIYYVDARQQKQGAYLYKYFNRVTVKGFYLNDLKDGLWVYNTDNKFIIKAHYKNGERDSVWTYYENSILKSTVPYKSGKKNGVSEGYYSNGVLSAKIQYDEGKIYGKRFSYYKNGNIQIEADYIKNRLNGDLKIYDENNRMVLYIIVKNDRPYSIEYVSPSYSAQIKGNLKNGTGSFEYYRMDSLSGDFFLVTHQEYLNGKLNGRCIEYFDKGSIKFKGNYINDNMVGYWQFYNPNVKKDTSVTVKYNLKDSTKKASVGLYNVTPTMPNFFITDKPKFEHVNINMFRYHVTKYLRYPEPEGRGGLQAKVYTSFRINEVGKLHDIKFLNSSTDNFEKECMRVLEASPPWVPAFQDNIPVSVVFTFPIAFVIQ